MIYIKIIKIFFLHLQFIFFFWGYQLFDYVLSYICNNL